MVKIKRRIYTLEFKQQVVQLASVIGVSRAANKLGVSGGEFASLEKE